MTLFAPSGGGRALVDAVREIAGDRLVIAEDLGDITPAVGSLLRYSGMPGMRVLQFAFLGYPKTPHLPHNYAENSVAYTGTHDNNTLLGYIRELEPEVRRRVFDYCGYSGTDFTEGHRAIVRTLLASHAALAILPIQDLLGFGPTPV